MGGRCAYSGLRRYIQCAPEPISRCFLLTIRYACFMNKDKIIDFLSSIITKEAEIQAEILPYVAEYKGMVHISSSLSRVFTEANKALNALNGGQLSLPQNVKVVAAPVPQNVKKRRSNPPPGDSAPIPTLNDAPVITDAKMAKRLAARNRAIAVG